MIMKRKTVLFCAAILILVSAGHASEEQWKNQKVKVMRWATAGTRANLDGRTLFAKAEIAPVNSDSKLTDLWGYVVMYSETGKAIKGSDKTEIGKLTSRRDMSFKLPKCPAFSRLVLTIRGKDNGKEFVNEFHGFSASRSLFFEPAGVIKGQAYVKIMGKNIDYSKKKHKARVQVKVFNKGELKAEEVELEARFIKVDMRSKKAKIIKRQKYKLKQGLESGKQRIVKFFVSKCPPHDDADVVIAEGSIKSYTEVEGPAEAQNSGEFVINLDPVPNQTYIKKCLLKKKKDASYDITVSLKNDMKKTTKDFVISLNLYRGKNKIKNVKISLNGTLAPGKAQDITINRKEIPAFSGADVSMQYNFLN